MGSKQNSLIRESSIHIGRKALILVLEKLFPNDTPVKWKHDKLADAILEEAKPYSLTHRQINVDKVKLFKSTNKVILSTRDDAGAFNNLVTMIRRKKGHKGISIIKVGSREWLQMKEAAKLALDFCNDFGLNREDGFKIYISRAIDKMQRFNLHKFNGLHQIICDEYIAEDEISKDMTPQLTQQCCQEYERLLGENHGIVRDYTKEPSKYIFFIRAKQEAAKYKISLRHYITSQFHGLKWANSYPDPSQLVGKGSIDRLNKYIMENNLRPKEDARTLRLIEAGEKMKQILDANDKYKRS